MLLSCLLFCQAHLYDLGRELNAKVCICCERGECEPVDRRTLPPLVMNLRWARHLEPEEKKSSEVEWHRPKEPAYSLDFMKNPPEDSEE